MPCDFRTQKRAAPLKLRAVISGLGALLRFPHAKTCGPIEAFGRERVVEWHEDFRTQKRAAPLKLIWAAQQGSSGSNFRTQKRAAPLKRWALGWQILFER